MSKEQAWFHLRMSRIVFAAKKLSQKQLNDIAHEHTIICRQLFTGHVVGSRPMKRKKHLHRMIITYADWQKSSRINPEASSRLFKIYDT